MNRVLYQLSYAAMWSKDFGTAEISFIIISNSFNFVKQNFKFSGNNLFEVISPEIQEVCSALYPGRSRLCRIGTVVAPAQSYQHVLFRRRVFPCIGPAAQRCTSLPFPPLRCWSGTYHSDGVCCRSFGQPAASGMELQRSALEPYGADLLMNYI